MMSSELDILVVGTNSERFTVEIRQAFRHWQVYNCGAPHALYARSFRRAYFTEPVLAHMHGPGILDVLRARGEVLPFEDYAPSVIDTESWEDAKLLREIRRSRHSE